MNQATLRAKKKTYADQVKKILRGNLVAYYPLWEAAGAEALDISGNKFDGDYTAVTLGQAGIGDGRQAAGFDGATSLLELNAAGFDLHPNNNIIFNGNFETLGGGGADVFATWAETAGDGAIDDETTLVNAGSHALKLTGGATPGSSPRETQSGIVTIPGQEYTLTFYTRGDGTNQGRYQVYDASNGASIIGTTDTGITGTDYTLVSVNFTAPAGCVSTTLYLKCPDVNGGIAYFDDVAIKPANGAGFSGPEGSLILHCKMGSGVWSDGTERYLAYLGYSSGYSLRVLRTTTNNTLRCQYVAEGITKTIDISMSPAGYFQLVLTWSNSADEFKAYINGVQAGSTQTGLGAWSGGATNLYYLGAKSATPTSVHSGDLAHVVIADAALTEAQIAAVMPPF